MQNMVKSSLCCKGTKDIALAKWTMRELWQQLKEINANASGTWSYRRDVPPESFLWMLIQGPLLFSLIKVICLERASPHIPI